MRSVAFCEKTVVDSYGTSMKVDLESSPRGLYAICLGACFCASKPDPLCMTPFGLFGCFWAMFVDIPPQVNHNDKSE